MYFVEVTRIHCGIRFVANAIKLKFKRISAEFCPDPVPRNRGDKIEKIFNFRSTSVTMVVWPQRPTIMVNRKNWMRATAYVESFGENMRCLWPH